ncbi:hypothetical protein MGN70_007452 [Eutypa lata]|nr:hypothetical protein MGN70_007452 [Eutypa lata]
MLPRVIWRLHEEYGPIVLINPEELHINDLEYYDVVFCNSHPTRPIDKAEKFRYRFGIPAGDGAVRVGRGAPAASRRNDDLQAVIERISLRLSREYAETGRVVNFTDMWSAMASGIITEMAFARPTDYVSAPDFRSPFAQATVKMVRYAHVMTHFNFLVSAMNWLTDAVLATLMPPFVPILYLRKINILIIRIP